MTTTLTHEDLSRFIGTDFWYRHSLVRHVTYTDGVKYLAETGGAYWLVDEIAFLQAKPEIKALQFQFWKLAVNADRTATLSCEDGDNNPVYSKRINYTDFPLNEIILYCIDQVILLRSEY